MHSPAPPAAAPSLGELFLGFLKIGVLGFGGIAPVARHVLVEDRRWLSEQEYASILGLGQVLPGANVCNASIMIGERFHGPLGSLVAITGLMAMPLVILISLATLYQHFAARPEMQAIIGGLAAAAAGLVVGTAIKMTWRLKPRRTELFFGLLAFGAVGLWRLPLPLAVVVLAPLSIAAAAWGRRQ